MQLSLTRKKLYETFKATYIIGHGKVCHVKRCNIWSFLFILYNFLFVLYNFPFILYNFLFILYIFLFVLYNFHLYCIISYLYCTTRPDDAWRIFDCSKHKHWRERSPRLCEINKISTRWPDAVCRCQFQLTERRKATHRLPLMSGPTCSYGYRYMQHPGGLGKHVLFHVDVMAT